MIKTVIYLRRTRDTYSPGKVLVTTFESHSNVAQVCLNYCRLNTLVEEEDEEGVQINDSDKVALPSFFGLHLLLFGMRLP
jgi:hypothetical protein